MADKKRRHEDTVSHYHDEYDKAIFIAGEKEIHFNAQIDGGTISRIKKLISLIVDDNKESLIKRLDPSESHVSHVSHQDDKRTSGKKVKDPDVVITYIVNSPGGSVIDILDFVDYIQLLRKTYLNLKFTSIITGMCASAATIMCVIADKKQMTRFAFAMIHELSTGLNRSNYTKVINHGSFIKSMHNHLLTIYNEFRGIGMDDQAEIAKIEDMMLRETWMTADEYRGHGFVEEIL